MNATIDLNPHQVEGALFYFKNPLSNWLLLADEVWLGKTIEAGLVLCQLWSELKKKIILVVPAALRKQRKSELDEKFFLPSEILDGKTYKQFRKQGIKNPFDQNKIIITSYQFTAKHETDIVKTQRNAVVIDEAHNLRNVYRNPTGTAAAIQRIFHNTKKILLTATPLQNTLMELYGLVSFIDTYTFWDRESFRKQFSQPNHLKLKDLKERLKPLMNRTLRSQVQEYIRYTKRIPSTHHFEPTDEEMELYNKISEFLRREDMEIISTKTRHLIILILRKLLASSSHAIAGTLDMMIERIEKELMAVTESERNTMIEVQVFLDVLRKAASTYKKASYVRKRSIIDLFVSNISVDKQKMLTLAVKPDLEHLFSDSFSFGRGDGIKVGWENAVRGI